jgi:hypothetical protein
MNYAVHEITFKIGKAGRTSAALDMVPIVDVEGLKLAIDGKMVDWSPMDQEGWARHLVTGKKASLSLTGKRNVGDAGNDYIAGTGFGVGSACESKIEITLPDTEGVLTGNVVIDVKTPFGGESGDASLLDFDIIFDGKPTFTPGV